MRWENHLDLTGIAIMVRTHIEDGLEQGAQIILDRSDELVPKVSGDLAATGSVKKDRGGINTVAVTYTSVYAHWIEANLSFAHPHGGGARFLEFGMIEKGSEAINKAGEVIWDRVTARSWGSV
jgi:hypothetical protein